MSDGFKGAMESLKIPLNLKSAYRPFVLDPNSDLCTIQENAAGAKGPPQVFTYRRHPWIGILPSSWGNGLGTLNTAINNDISMKLIYGMDASGKVSNKSVGLGHLLQHIPMVQIREYQQDSKLNQLFSLLGGIKEGFDAGSGAATSGNSLSDTLSSLGNNAKKWWKTFKWIILNPDTFVKELIGPLETNFPMMCNKNDPKTYMSVIQVPNILYYRMISSLTLNIFELPFSGEFVREANGHGGWASKKFGDFKGLGNTGIFSLLDKALDFVGSNIKVSMTPTWDGAAEEEGTTIEFTVNLFNDSINSACVNFILVNTLLPGMMFSQYHIFQMSPSLFDIKVDGLGRYFMCSGSVKVEYKGVLRTPSPKIIENLATKYKNPMYSFDANYLRESGMVKIPDVYQITLQFKSLLPNSFNNYIYQHCANKPITKKDPIYQDSLYSQLSSQFKATIDEISGKLEKGEEPFQTSQAQMDQANAEEAMEAHNEEVERMNNGEASSTNNDDYPPGMGPNDYEEG